MLRITRKMNRIRNKLFCAILFFIVSVIFSLCWAKEDISSETPIEVITKVDKASVTIGDKIKYSIVISKDKDIEVDLKDFGHNFGNFSIKDFGSEKKSFFKKEKVTQWFLLDTYITGKSIIPKVIVKYKESGEKDWKEIEGKEAEVEVKSLLQSGPEESDRSQMYDIAGPVKVPNPKNKFLVLFFIFAFLSLLAAVVYIFFKKKKKASIKTKSADQIAYEQLDILKNKDYITKGLIKQYYIEISDIIRHYLGNRFNLRAPEMTTEEFLAGARDSSFLLNEHKLLLKEFLVCCDLVKFAKYAPAENEINSVFDSAKRFVDQTKENDNLKLKAKNYN